MTYEDLMNGMIEISLAAGLKIMDVYAGAIDVQHKEDSSPVTDADKAGEEIILEGLKRLAPDVPTLAEESASEGKIPELGDRFFLVDPLDGTKEFIKKTGEFTVNIALIENGAPVMGVVYAPAIKRLFYGIAGAGAYSQEIAPDENRDATTPRALRVRADVADGVVAVASRSHRSPETDDYLSTLTVKSIVSAGSSLKFCLVAAGEADVYPRLGRTMEWDTGAGQAVLEAAGGQVVDFETRQALRYGKKERGFDNPHFIAMGAAL